MSRPTDHPPLTCAEAQRMIDWYREENGALLAVVAGVTQYVPANLEFQSEGTVSVPIRRLVLVRDLARGRITLDAFNDQWREAE